ncbi:MAG: hypothetical protein FVQ78_06670 [Solirubrobacterales bacterium]|nr:hypothetical protein [Solirubrobacterales bacterium]
MASLNSISPAWPGSPAAGKLPTDPYYKLRRQAEMMRPAGAVTSALDKASLWGVLDQNRRTLEATSKPLAAVDAATRTASRAIQPTLPSHLSPGAQGPYPTVTSVSPTPSAQPPADASDPHADPERAPRQIDQIVETHQQESEEWLGLAVPSASAELRLAAARLDEAADAVGAEQAALLAQGLGSVRRAIKMVADFLHPPNGKSTHDRFGDERKADDASYASRLSLVFQQSSDSKGRYLFDKAELDLFHRRLTRMIDRLGAGVHGEADFEEARQLYVDVWRLIGACRQSRRM